MFTAYSCKDDSTYVGESHWWECRCLVLAKLLYCIVSELLLCCFWVVIVPFLSCHCVGIMLSLCCHYVVIVLFLSCHCVFTASWFRHCLTCLRWGETPLHQSAYANKHRDFMRMLLRKGADVNARSKTKATPLRVRSWGAHVEVNAISKTQGTPRTLTGPINSWVTTHRQSDRPTDGCPL